jgi:hypothetical protein
MKFGVFWDVRTYAPLKRRSTSTWLHGATSQKTVNFILVAVGTWNLTTSTDGMLTFVRSNVVFAESNQVLGDKTTLEPTCIFIGY